MKIITFVLIALLIVTLGYAAVFYFNTFKPMAADYARLQEGLPGLEKAKAELKQYRDKENKENAWLTPAVDILRSALGNEIKAGKAEVVTAGNRVIVNIAEDAIFQRGSYVFSKDSLPLRQILTSLLKKNELEGKQYIVGNTTESVPAQGRGRRKIPAKDARSLAAQRSQALIKDFEKNGVPQYSLIAAAYSSKQPEIGFNLKSRKTVIIVENPLTATMVQAQPPRQALPKPNSTSVAPETTQPPQSKLIPIQPAQPQTH